MSASPGDEKGISSLGLSATPLPSQEIKREAKQDEVDDFEKKAVLPSSLVSLIEKTIRLKNKSNELLTLLNTLKPGPNKDKTQQEFNRILKNYGSSKNTLIKEINALIARGNALGKQNHFDKSLECYQQAFLIDRQIESNENTRTASILGNIGNILYESARYKKAIVYFQKSLLIFETLLGKNCHQVALGLNNLGNAFSAEGQFDIALKYLNESLNIYKKLGEEMNKAVAMVLNNIAEIFAKQHKFLEAIRDYKQALLLNKQFFGEKSKETALILTNMARLFQKQGCYKKVLKYHQEVLAIYQNVEDVERGRADTLDEMGIVFLKQGFYAQAFQHHNQALVIYEKILGKESIHVAHVFNNIGNVFLEQNHFYQALPYYEKAIAIYEKLFGKDSYLAAEVLVNVAHIQAKQERYETAFELYQKILIIHQRKWGEESHPVADLLYNIGNVLLGQNKYDLAFNYYKKSLLIKEKIFGKKSLEVAVNYQGLGNLFLQQDNYQQALWYFERALSIRQQLVAQNNPSITSLLTNMGTLFKNQCQYEKALEYYEQAFHLLDEDSHHRATLLVNIGQVCVDQSRHEQAMEHYSNALALEEKLYGENSPPVAKLVTQIANIFTDHKLYSLASEYYQRGLAILEKTLGKETEAVAMALGNISLCYAKQEFFKEAFEHAEKALSIFKQISPDHDNVAIALGNIGSLWVNQKKYAEAIRYQKQALAIRKRLRLLEHPITCRVQMQLASTHVLLANTLEEKERNIEYQNAVLLCEEMLKVDDAILEKHWKKFNIYDLGMHTALLHLLSYTYAAQGNYRQAGYLYFGQAKQYQDKFPIVALHYSACALECLSVLADQKIIIELYQLRAQIGYQHRRYGFAIHQLQKALRLDPSDKSCQETFKLCEQGQLEEMSYLDEDLYAQLEFCRDRYDDIQITIVQELEHVKTLSQATKNQIPALIIKINNILDIAFGRFVRRAIYSPNGFSDRQDLYYPLSGSQAVFDKELKKKDIIICADEFPERIFKKLPRPQGVSIREALKQKHYIDEKSCVLPKALKDETLDELEDALEPIKKDLSVLLTKAGVGKPISRKQLSALNVKIQTDSEYQPPEKDLILKRLVERGFITPCTHTLPHVFKLTDPLTLTEAKLKLNLEEGKGDAKQFSRYEGVIVKQLKKEMVTRQKYVSLEKSYPSVYALLIKEQPFSYYSRETNKENQEFFEHSWLDKIIAISNGNKHITLMPQGILHDLAEQAGLISMNNLKITLHYVDPVFWPWVFVNILKDFTELRDEQLIGASQSLLRALKEKGYIQKGSIIHPLAIQYLQLVKKSTPHEERLQAEKDFFHQLENDLPKTLKSFAEPVSQFILRHLLQSSHLELHANHYVDLHKLIDKSLMATREIILALGKENAPKRKPLPSIKIEKITLELKLDKALEQQEIFNKLFTEPDKLQLLDYLHHHQWLLEAKRIYCVNNKMNEVGKLYYEAARRVTQAYPSLALYYFKKSFHYLSSFTNQYQNIEQVCLLLSQEYAARGLWLYALSYLEQGSHKFNTTPSTKLAEKQTEYHARLKKILECVDTDIYSQLEHAKYQFLMLQYYCFRLLCHPENRRLQHIIQNLIADIVIKLRHLLDQSLTKLVHTKVYWPNNKWATINIKNTIRFYCYASVEELRKELSDKEIINDDKSKVSLDRDFPKVYQLLEAQSSLGATPSKEKQHWLIKIITLSNCVKHVGLRFLSSSELADRLTNVKHVDDFYCVYDISLDKETKHSNKPTTMVHEPVIPLFNEAFMQAEHAVKIIFEAITPDKLAVSSSESKGVYAEGPHLKLFSPLPLSQPVLSGQSDCSSRPHT